MRNVDWGDGLKGPMKVGLVAAVIALLLGNMVALAAYDGSSPSSSSSSADQSPAAGPGTPHQGSTEEAAARPKDAVVATTSTTASAGGGGAGKQASAGQAGQASTASSVPEEEEEEGDVPPPTTHPNPYVYRVTLVPQCLRPGEEFTLTAHVDPGVTVGMIARYADRNQKPMLHNGTAGDDGVIVHRWRAPASPGEGSVLTGARGPDGRPGSTTVTFRIVEVTDTC